MPRRIRLRTTSACAGAQPSALAISVRVLPASISLTWADVSASCSKARNTSAIPLCSWSLASASGASSASASSASSQTKRAASLRRFARIPYSFVHP